MPCFPHLSSTGAILWGAVGLGCILESVTRTNLSFLTQSHREKTAGDFSDYSCLQESVDNLTCELPSDLTVKKGAERSVRDDEEEKGQAWWRTLTHPYSPRSIT